MVEVFGEFFNVKSCDVLEENVTTRWEILIETHMFLRVGKIRED